MAVLPDELCVGGNCRTYEVAAGCTTCPCTDVCSDLIDSTHVCCDSGATNDVAVCVRGNTCP